MPARVEMLQGILLRADPANDPAQRPFATSKAFDAGLTDLHDRGLVGWDRERRTYHLHPMVRGVVWRGLLGAESRAYMRRSASIAKQWRRRRPSLSSQASIWRLHCFIP